MIIRPESLTSKAFAAYGQVLESDGVVAEFINQGHTQKYADLAEISSTDGGRAQFSIYRSSAIELPFKIAVMERHPLGSQAFYPLHQRPFPVLVAVPGCTPGAGTIKAFLTNGKQGINIRAGVWHHYQLSLEQESDYIVIDRKGPGDNCDEYHLDDDLFLQL